MIDADELDTEPELPPLPVAPQSGQFPALAGDHQGEIEQRAPQTGAQGQFTRTFSVGQLGIGPGHWMHVSNAVAVATDAIQRGLHPHGDVHLVDAVEHDEPRSKYTDLTYAVDVVPASVDTDSASVLTPSVITAAQAAEIKREAP